jgi:nuclear transport factor 2 (NTF2) superfamily protein
MKKTNLILLALLAILGSAAAWFLVMDKGTNLTGYDFDFAIKDTANIGKIFIANREGNTVTLTRQSTSEWQVNGKYKVRKDAIKNLLETVGRIELKYRLPRNAVSTVVKDVASNGIKVEIYAKNGKKMKSYYVGGVNMDETGTNMMMEDANEPYVMHIPNFVGAVRVRYFIDEIDWRDRMVFTLTPEDIKSVSIDYPLQKSQSFKLFNERNGYKIEPFYPLTPRIDAPPIKALAENFLTGFCFLGAEGFENGFANLDSIRHTTPFCIIKVEAREGAINTLTLHQIVPHNADGSLIQSVEGNVEIEKYYAETEKGDLLLIQHLVFQKIFWGYPSFFGKQK